MKTQGEIALDPQERVEHTPLIYLDRFPKEFKKNWFAVNDFRFLAILLGTLFTAIAMLSFLNTLRFNVVNVEKVTDFHENYARILIKDQAISNEDFFPAEKTVDDTYLFGLETSTGRASESPSSSADDSNSESSVSEASSASSGRSATRRTYTSSGTSSEGSGVSQVGLLKYIATDSRMTENVSGGVLADIGDADNYAALTSLNRNPLRTNTGSAGNQYTNYSVKGSKLEDVGVGEVIGSISGKSEALAKVVVKNVDWEEVPSTDNRNNLARRKDGLTRSPEEISKIMLAHNRTIQDCYKHALKRDNSLKGKIVVKFTVNPDGEVNDVQIVKSNLNNSNLERCILRRIERWKDFGFCDPKIGDLTYKQTYVFGY